MSFGLLTFEKLLKPKDLKLLLTYECTHQGCRSLLSIGGDNLQLYPQFCFLFCIGGMNLDHGFIQVSKLSEDHKKKVFTKNETLSFPNSGEEKKRSSSNMEHFFSPNSSGLLRSDAHQSQTIGGDEDVDHTQTIGGNSQIIGGGDISHYVVWRIYWWGGYLWLVWIVFVVCFWLILLPRLAWFLICFGTPGTHQQPQERFTSLKKIQYGKSCSYFTLIQKYN